MNHTLYHPHVHYVIPSGGLSPDGKSWVKGRPRFFLPVPVLSKLFRGKFIAGLNRLRRKGLLEFGRSTAHLAETREWEKFVRGLWRKEWVVYSKRPFGGPVQVLKYLARYTHRVAISNRRLVSVTDDGVTFRYRDRSDGNRERQMKLKGPEFLRRFLLHILPKGFMRTRHFGFLANQCRRKKLAVVKGIVGEAVLEPDELGDEIPEDTDHEKSVTEATPTEAVEDHGRRCPSCGGPLIRIREIARPAQEPEEKAVGRDTS